MSYTWDDGEEGAKTAERPAVWIRKTGEEVKVGRVVVSPVVSTRLTGTGTGTAEAIGMKKSVLVHVFCMWFEPLNLICEELFLISKKPSVREFTPP